MATPTQLRDRVSGLTTLAARDLAALWRRLEVVAAAEEPLRDVLPALIATYGEAAAVVAADWYDELRAKSDVRGRFAAIPAGTGDAGAQALVGWALAEAESPQSLRALIEGGMQRRIANAARTTVTGSALADPRADGWQRVGDGACAFCRMLIGRGAVYSEATVDFASHDHCGCSAAPAFSGMARPVKPYVPSLHGASDADRARVRDYIAGHDL